MIATILDTLTEKTHTQQGINPWNYYDGNWGCDCNRWPEDTPLEDRDDECVSLRFLVVAFEFEDGDEEYAYLGLADFNDGYPPDLLRKYNLPIR